MEKEKNMSETTSIAEIRETGVKTEPRFIWNFEPSELAKLIEGEVIFEEGHVAKVESEIDNRFITIKYPKYNRDQFVADFDGEEMDLENCTVFKESEGLYFVSPNSFVDEKNCKYAFVPKKGKIEVVDIEETGGDLPENIVELNKGAMMEQANFFNRASHRVRFPENPEKDPIPLNYIP
jgi:hypothetical protein